jgi:hypothetical protein
MPDFSNIGKLYQEAQKRSIKAMGADVFGPKHFQKSMAEFKAAVEAIDNMLYEGTLGFIDQGSGRDTYRLDKNHVIKIALGDTVATEIEIAEEQGKLRKQFFSMIQRGIAQNKAEANSNDCAVPEVVTRVVDHDPGFLWVIEEYASPIRSNEEFERYTGIAFMKLQGLIKMSERDRAAEIKRDSHFRKNPWFMNIVKTMKSCGLSWTDLVALEHYGRIGKRVVLVDHGGTKKVMNSLYEFIKLIVKESLEEQIPVGTPTRPGLAGYMKKNPGAPTGTQATVAATQEPEKTMAGIRPGKPAQQVRPSGEEGGDSPDELMAAIQSKLGSIQDPGKLRQILSLLKN